MTAQGPVPPGTALPGLIRLAVMAVGGQGGGVLTGWIEALARGAGWSAQATSVAGVSQRTGATIYYVEMAPPSERPPVFALMPAAGDVDVLVAAEMMEAGRAILRGFVTPDRTTLIASTHRALAVSEKTVPGDGIASSEEVRAAAGVAARAVVMADFEWAARGSVISASLFGGLAASGALPFPREAFEAAIRAGGVGVEASLRAFAAGWEAARGQEAPAARARPKGEAAAGPAAMVAAWAALVRRAEALPGPVAEMARRGLRKVVDFQDLPYGEEYLGIVEASGGAGEAYRVALAKHLAVAMAYDDVIRVADLKTRGPRFDRVREEMGAGGRVLRLTEFMHPRAEEMAGMLPVGLGRRVVASPLAMRVLGRLSRGRRLRSDGFVAFGLLWLLGGLRAWRRRTLRDAEERAHRAAWLARAGGLRERDEALATEALRARRLVKGYSDTHARGLSKFDRVMAGIARLEGRADAAAWARRMIEAALRDEEGKALDGVIRTVEGL